MYALVRPGALARPAGRARLPLAPGGARPWRLRVVRPVVRGTAVDATQPGSGGGGGSALKPPFTGGGDGDNGERAPGAFSLAGFWDSRVPIGDCTGVAASLLAAAFSSLKTWDEVSRSVARTADLAALRTDTVALGDKLEASMATLRADTVAVGDKLEASMATLRADTVALGDKLAARMATQDDTIDKILDVMVDIRLEAQAGRLGLETLAGRFTVVLVAVLGTGLAVWLGRKPGTGRGAE